MRKDYNILLRKARKKVRTLRLWDDTLALCYARRVSITGGTLMEKVIYVLWRDATVTQQAFNTRLRGETAERLLAAKAHAVRVNVCDEAVAPAAPLRQVSTRPQMEAVIQVWLNSSLDRFRLPIDEIVREAAPRMAAYLVTESQIIPNTLHPPKKGQRTEGFLQVVFLQRPPRLTREAWLHIWQKFHTAVGVDTQSNFEYVQNPVIHALTHAAPVYDAMIEECFPAAAMTNPQAFYDAVGDEEKFQRNLKTMMDSVARFIDFDKLDVLPTSQYVIKALS